MSDNYALVGHPLGHSFSARWFNDKFEREGLDARYVNLDLEDIGELPHAIEEIGNLRGVNVTIPYKRSVIGLLSRVSAEAEAIGAVNCVRVEEDGSLSGFNTDWIGFRESLKHLLPPGFNSGALILGTGGASAAVAYALESLGIEYVRVSRTSVLGILTYEELTEEILREHLLIINTTSLGTYPSVETCPALPYQFLGESHICHDLVYNPAFTEFMRRSAQRGAKVKNGLEMLRLQAEAAWQIWNTGGEFCRMVNFS